jgi:hypothetical protein
MAPTRFLALAAALAAVASAAPADSGTPTGTSLPVPTDACLAFCEGAFTACNEAASIPGNPNHPECASWFSQCLGYAPFENGNFVTPTACSSASVSPAPTSTDAPDACAAACISSYYTCSSAPNANQPLCAYDVSVCLGYSPWTNGFWVAPTSCANDNAVTTTTVVTAYTTYCPGPTHIVHNNKTITVTGATTLTVTDCPCTITTHIKPAQPTAKPTGKPAPQPDGCVAECDKAHVACQIAPDANMAECAAEFSNCLGYNPWGSGSYVTPTACSATASSTEAPVVVPTGAAGRVVPGALAALGAFALL